MEKKVWYEHREGEINEKIRYWVDRWQELIENFNLNSYGLQLSSPHLLIKGIWDEIRDNDLRSAETRKVFKAELSRVLREDLIVQERWKVEFANLIKQFDKSDLLYLSTICGIILP